jgi:hypothetical protein
LRVIDRTGHFLAIAGDEWHRRDIVNSEGKFLGDLSVNGSCHAHFAKETVAGGPSAGTQMEVDAMILQAPAVRSRWPDGEQRFGEMVDRSPLCDNSSLDH